MRSPRSTFESACRVGAFAIIGWMLGASVFSSVARRTQRATAAELPQQLPAWTRSAPSVALHGELPTAPEAWVVDWLAALRHSGHTVSWTGTPPAVAMSAEALPDPNGGVRIELAAPESSTVVLHDDVSAIDSVRVGRLGATVVAPEVAGVVRGVAAGQQFSAPAPDSVRTRAIVVIGEAGWEGKFIASALEERGWPVIARFSVAPAVDVAQAGAPLSLDTAHVAAVVAVDTTIARLGEAVGRYVRSGGGLVLAGASARSASVAQLAPGATGARIRPAVLPRDTIGLGSTGFYPVSSLKPDGVALERRADGIAVAARRVGSGRVVQVGYDDSWRWRMAGATGSEAAHRAWWARVVGAVAYAPSAGAPVAIAWPPRAPVAYLVDRAGPARASAPANAGRGPLDSRILMTLTMLLLLAEWGSRRLRGRR